MEHRVAKADAEKRKAAGTTDTPEIEKDYGYTSFNPAVFCSQVLMFTTNFSLHDAVYRTVSYLSGGTREHVQPDMLIAAATILALLGGIVAFFVQIEASKINDPSEKMRHFYGDCVKILVMGLSYAIGKV
jgi:hypothetical protein